MSAPYLRLLGAPEVGAGPARQPLGATAPHALLAYLAVSGDWVSRQELAYLFRPDDADADALRYLRLQIHRAQRLDWAGGLEVTDARLRWPVDSDVARFRQALADNDAKRVIAIYGGTLLTGFVLRAKPTFETWQAMTAAELETSFRSALARHGDALERAGDWHAATAVAERRLGIDPFDEGAHRALMRALAALDRRTEALHRHQAFTAQLADEMGVGPDPDTRKLAETLQTARCAPAPTAQPASAPDVQPVRGALPHATTRFVGRRLELGELSRLLADPGCRLLTVVGLGGSGKTRLALEAARARAPALPGGACFVAGAEVSTVAQWQARLGSAVGVEPARARDPGAALVHALADRALLLVLDNLEHLPGVERWIAALLEGAPQVQVLATSRAPLALQSEWAYDVSGLSLPDGDDLDGDAVALFLDAARRAAPRLTIGAAELPVVARICRRVGGLPLPLELAAAWVRAMPVAAIADALDGDIALLVTDRGDVPARHRSVAAVLERTWADLTAAKREALMRLVPFVGGCTLATAQAVTGVPPTLWLSLLQQSLLERRGPERLAPHPLVAEHAAARLAEQPALAAAARDAHAAHFMATLERAAGQGSAGLVALDDDVADLEQAWTWLLGRGNLATAARAAPAFFERYDLRGAFQAGMDLGRRALAALPSATRDDPADPAAALRRELLLAVATLAWEAGEYEAATSHAGRVLALAEANGDTSAAARAQRRLGDIRQSTGDFEGASRAYALAECAFAALADMRGQADVLNSWASMDAVRERYRDAQHRFERCAALFASLGATKDAAIAQTNLGFVAEAQGALPAAARHYEAGLSVFERIGFARGQAAVQNNLVVLYGKQGRFDAAEAMGQASLAAKQAMGDALAAVVTLKNLGDLMLLRGDPAGALARFLPALRTAHEHGAVPRLLQVLVGTAEALAHLGEQALAGRVAQAVVAHPSSPASLIDRARSLRTLEGADTFSSAQETIDLDGIVAEVLARG